MRKIMICRDHRCTLGAARARVPENEEHPRVFMFFSHFFTNIFYKSRPVVEIDRLIGSQRYTVLRSQGRFIDRPKKENVELKCSIFCLLRTMKIYRDALGRK